jgi:Flp pilus assembly pilin Flp
MKFWKKLFKSRKGAALFEYSLLLAGVGLVTIAAVSVFGHKVSDMTAAVATVLPGAHDEDNNPIVSGQIIETDDTTPGLDSGGGSSTGIGIDVATITSRSDTRRLGVNTGINDGATQDLADLVIEVP